MAGCPHFDLTATATFVGGLPRETFAWLRNEAPLYWHEKPASGSGFWVVSKQKELDFISKNPRLFSSEAKSCLLNEVEPERLELMRLQMINMDPPRHLKYRRLVRNAFTPKKVDSYAGRFRAIAKDILDRATVHGHCEFVRDIASELPLIAICELMGVPSQKRQRLFETDQYHDRHGRPRTHHL